MAKVEMLMPKMGESIFECTVLNWLKNVGDKIEADDMIIEVATDKIDTEIGTTHVGILKEILVNVGETAFIGKPICIIETEGDENIEHNFSENGIEEAIQTIETSISEAQSTVQTDFSISYSGRFYSPLVQNIAKTEGISQTELDSILGTGQDNRVTKHDILAFLANKNKQKNTNPIPPQQASINIGSTDQIIEMDRMRRMIADRMVESKQISPHVTSFVESDLTSLVIWRNKIKDGFKKDTGQNFTFTPLLIEAVVKAIKDFPLINVQVNGSQLIVKKDINIGMAVALPNGNLIVPVIHNADRYSLIGLSNKVNDLAERARKNQLKPDELVGGTYTVSNIGNFGNIAGTPIILQPQVAIMAFGVIRKLPAVIETPQGDLIGIRQKMIISHAYDHRVVDGSLGGMFAKRVADYLENFDLDRKLI